MQTTCKCCPGPCHSHTSPPPQDCGRGQQTECEVQSKVQILSAVISVHLPRTVDAGSGTQLQAFKNADEQGGHRQKVNARALVVVMRFNLPRTVGMERQTANSAMQTREGGVGKHL